MTAGIVSNQREELHEWLDERYPLWSIAYTGGDLTYFNIDPVGAAEFFRNLIATNPIYDGTPIQYDFGRVLTDQDKIELTLAWGADWE